MTGDSSAAIPNWTKLGILGGTFDPVHYGHLLLAQEAKEEFGLDGVLFMPAAVPPHKQGNAITDARSRLRMIELAIADNEGFAVSDLELVRTGPSYTVETIREIKRQKPTGTIFLILGADQVNELSTWYCPVEIMRTAKICVAYRPGVAEPRKELLTGDFPPDLVEEMLDRRLRMPLIEISSTMIRGRIRSGRSIRYLTPPAVCNYIAKNQIYAA